MSELEIQRSLGRIEGKIDEINHQLTAGQSRMDNFETRIRKLEMLETIRKAQVGVIGAISGALVTVGYKILIWFMRW